MLVVEAMPEGVAVFATVPYRTQAYVDDPSHNGRQEDEPEIPSCRIGVPEVGRRAEVEKCGHELRDCHGYIVPNLSNP
jgi:hypothetical protein